MRRQFPPHEALLVFLNLELLPFDHVGTPFCGSWSEDITPFRGGENWREEMKR
jgi:hypothetical protein